MQAPGCMSAPSVATSLLQGGLWLPNASCHSRPHLCSQPEWGLPCPALDLGKCTKSQLAMGDLTDNFWKPTNTGKG